ncbi:hypothetical protein [Streptomyces longispororuber]|uniref:hypothetical protein n=1 Tax=Streptomyces longispororuber TaxID=68230 RepID=UPI0036FDD640
MSVTAEAAPRIKRRSNYVHVESTTVRDTRIRYCDLGLLTYLLDQSEDWQVRSEQLSKGEGREGRDAVRKMLHRLASCGYYRLERRRLRTGKTVMGTAISDHPVEQWAADYVTFGRKLDIPVVEQEDGTFLVTYPDGSLGSDGFGPAPLRGQEPPAGAADEPQAQQPEQDLVVAQPKPARRPPRTPQQKKTDDEAKKAAAAKKAAQKKTLDEAAEKVAKWWWEHAETHLGPYVGDSKGYIAMRTQVRAALAKGYTQQQCAKALQETRQHWPGRQQWQTALGVVTNHIQPRQPQGRIPYSDSATWGDQSNTPAPTAAAAPADDSDDATFGIVTRP